MIVFIEIIEGLQIGTEFPLKEGDFLGLQQENSPQTNFIVTNESNKIAYLDLNSNGKALLADSNSPSGLWINGVRVKQVLLKNGVIFQLENQFFKVTKVIVNEDSFAEASESDWKQNLKDNLKISLLLNPLINQYEPNELLVFNPPLKIQFLKGVQTDEIFVLGYGPRQFGRDILDCRLLNPKDPAHAFDLLPTSKGALLVNKCGSMLKINNSEVIESLLNVGDEISLGTHLMKVVE
jgi:hypothetical protein